jgi:hypothetical protein
MEIMRLLKRIYNMPSDVQFASLLGPRSFRVSADVVPSTRLEVGDQIKCHLLSKTAHGSGEDWTRYAPRKVYTTRSLSSAS